MECGVHTWGPRGSLALALWVMRGGVVAPHLHQQCVTALEVEDKAASLRSHGLSCFSILCPTLGITWFPHGLTALHGNLVAGS